MATINSGITMRIIPLTQYKLSSLGNNGSAAIALATHIEAGPFTEADVLVRLHNNSTLGVGCTVTIGLYGDGYDFEDPSSSFFTTSALNSVALSSTSNLPYYTVFSASASTTPFGRYLAILATFQQPAAAVTILANMSIDLTLKGGDPSAMPMAPNSYRGYRLL